MAYQSEIEKLEQRFSEKPEQWFAAVADAYRKAGELDRALEILDIWIEKRPKYTSGHIVKGRCLVDKGADREAAPVFEGVLGLDPENIIALKTLAEIAERASDRDGAVRWIERLLEVDPMNEEALEAKERLLAPPEVEEAPAEAGAAPEPAVATAEVSASVAVEEPLIEVEQMPDTALELQSTVPEEPALVELEAAARQSLAFVEVEEPAALPEPAAALEFEPTAVELPEEPAAEPAALPEFEVSVEAEPPVAPLPAMEDEFGGIAEMPVDADAPELEPALESREPVAGFEPTADEPVLPEPAAASEPEVAEVAGFEPPVPMEEAEEVGVVADDLGLEPFDEDLSWGAGERVSRAITEDDIQNALHAHDDNIDDPVHAIPGLEAEEVPTVGGEGRETPATPGLMGIDTIPHPAPVAAAAAADDTALPLIMPDSGWRDGEPTAAVEPEPVLTETMAELYAKQGLIEQARVVYEGLLDQRPGDPHLLAKLQALKGGPARAAKPAARYSVAVTGGTPVGAFFAGMAAARPGDAMLQPQPQPAPPPPEPAAPGPPAPEPPPDAGQQSGFSFDQFFEGGEASAPPEGKSEPATGGGEKEDDDFRSWLKGLKT